MAIVYLDKIKSGIPTTIIEGKDVDSVIIIDPDPAMPPFFLANRLSLNSATKTVTVYDGSGVSSSTFNIDASSVEALVQALESEVNDTNDLAQSAHNIAVSAQTEAAINTAAIAATDVTVAIHGDKLAVHRGELTVLSGEMVTVKQSARAANLTADEALAKANINTEGIANLDLETTDLFNGFADHELRILSNTAKADAAVEQLGENEFKIATLETDVVGLFSDVERIDAEIAAIEAETVLRNNTNIHVKDISTSTGTFKLDDPNRVIDKYDFSINGTSEFTFTGDSVDFYTKPLTNVGTGGELDTNAANIGDVKRIATNTNPDLANYVEKMSDAPLNSVEMEFAAIGSTADEGLILEGDTLYAKSSAGYQHFFIEDGKFNVKSKLVQNVRSAVDSGDAVNKGQLDIVDTKATAADTLSKSNKTSLDTLSQTVGENTAQIGINTSSIASKADQTELAIVKATANEADALSKTNKSRLDTVDGELTDISAEVTNATTIAQSAKDSVDTLSTTVAGNTAQLSTNTKDIGDNSTLLAAVSDVANQADTLAKSNQSAITGLNSAVDVNTAEIASVKVTAENADTLSKSNATSLAGKADQTELAAVKATANEADALSKTNKSRLDSNDTTISDIEADVTSVTNRVSSNETNIENLSTTVGGNASAISSLNSTVGSLSGEIDAVSVVANQADTLAKANQSAITGLNSAVDNNTAQVSANTSEIASVKTTAQNANTLAKSNETALAGKASQADLNTVSGVANAADALSKSNQAKLTNTIITDSDASVNSLHVKTGNYNSDENFDLKVKGTNILSGTQSAIYPKKNIVFQSGTALIKGVGDAVDSKDAMNKQSVEGITNALSTRIDNLPTFSTEEWFEVAQGSLASNGNRPTGGTSDSNLNVWHTTVEAATTAPNNELKIAYNGAYGKVKDWSFPLRYKFVQGDKVQYWNVGANGWVTGSNVWHLSADAVEGDDLVIGTNTVVYASPYIGDSGGDSPQEMDGFKKYITTSSAATYYEHQGDSHLYIDWTGNGGMISLDTMRKDGDQQEDIFMLHNKTDAEMSVRFFFDGSSVTQIVTGRSFVQGWANRDLGQWVIGTYKDPSYVPEQLIIKATDLSWSTSSDPRINTQRMLAAAPAMCTIIGRHISSGSAKEKIVSVGDSNRLESQTSTFVVNKHSSGHATGISTSEENSGKTWSRVLDGKRGAWFTNESANSRMASGDIVPSEYPEEQIFFTTDKGIMETYIDEVDGEIKLRSLEGYNVPKNEADIAALEVQTEKNRSVTHYFINESGLSYDWPDETRKPLVEVGVLDTTQTINNSSVTITDNNTHKYSGSYNTVGSIAINSTGNWSNQYTYHNCYKHVSEDYYVVFNQGNVTWQIIESANPHTSIGSSAAAVTVQLGGQTSLPESFGDYTIDPNFDNIDSLEFLTAEVPIQYDDVNSRVIINFNGAKPSGYVVLK